MTTLKKQTISGVKWVFLASIAQKLLSLGATVILARILSPADFGLFALAFVMIDGFGIFKSLGFDSALVRRKDDIDKAANTAFFLIPTMGLSLFIILFFVAPLGANFLGTPSVTNVIRALALIFVIGCFGKVPQTMLYRNMSFNYKAIAEVSAQLVYVLTAVILALNKLGVWSLVIAYVLKNIVQTSIEWYFSGWKPKLEFDKTIAWDMFHFGKFVLLSSIIGFLYGNMDNIVIAKYLGITMLGYYAISMNISNILSDYFFAKVGMVMYPAYSKLQDDSEDIKKVMLKALRYISTVILPFSFGLFVFAPDILRVVYGQKWLPATNVLRILAFVGIFRSLGSAIWPVFMARGKSKVDFQIGLTQVVIFFVLLILLAGKFKLIGAGIAALLAALIAFVIGLHRMKKIANIRPLDIFEALKPALGCSLLMLVGAFLIKSLMASQHVAYGFLISASSAALIYAGATYVTNRSVLKDMKEAFI